MNPKVAIIILNWNGWKDTIECLESLYQISYPNSEAFSVNALRVSGKGCYDVIVVDNGSKDDSIQKIKEYCEGKIEVESKFFEYFGKNKPIKIVEYRREEAEAGGGKEKEIIDLPSDRKLIIIKNEKNYGFAEGNNIAMRYALKALNPDYSLLLNNDAVVDKEFLTELVKVGESDEKIGIVGPKIYYYDKQNRIQSAGVKISKIYYYTVSTTLIGCGEIENGQYDEIAYVDQVSGCCLLFKKSVIDVIGFLDQDYFAYYEERDFCLRAKKSGFKVFFVPKSKIWHKISSTAKKINGFTLYYMTRNRFKFAHKHLSIVQKFIFIIHYSLRIFPIIFASIVIKQKDFLLLKIYFRAIKDGIFNVNGFTNIS